MEAGNENRIEQTELEKKIEMARSHESEYKQILDSMMEGFQIIGRDWKILYVNEAMCRFCSRSKDQFENVTVMDCHPGLEKTKLFTEMKKCMANRIPAITEEELSFPDGTKRWLRVSIYPHPDGIFVLAEDISELKNAQKLVEENEKMYHEIVSKSPNLILIQREGIILYANKSGEALTGYTQDEVVGRSVLDFVEAHHRKTVEANTIKRTRGEEIPDYEIQIVTKTGERKDVLVRGTLLKYRGQTAIMNILVDFTHRRKVEKALKESEEMLQQTLDSMMEGFQIISREWRYVYINDSGVKHSRRSREELIGKTMMECYPGIEKTEMFNELNRCMKNRIPSRFENEFEYPDGTKARFLLSIHPHRQGIFVLSEDITNIGKGQEKTQLF